jgi:flagellar basal body-associated protein FliL
MKRNKINPLVLSYVIVLVVLAAIGYLAEDYHMRFLQQKTLIAEDAPTALVFLDLPKMDVTLSSPAGAPERVKVALSLQVMRKNLLQLEGYQPRITDRIIVFLRQQDVEKIRQPAASSWLRKSLLSEANDAANNQVPITDVVFRQFVVQ